MYSPSDPRSQLLSGHDIDRVLYQAYGGPPPRPGGYTADPAAAALAATEPYKPLGIPADHEPMGVLDFLFDLICAGLEGGE